MNLIFTNPSLLYLLPLVVGPIILHLISRDKPKKVYFPSIRFLTIGKVPSNEKKKLTDLLILLIRTLIVLFLVLFFAGLNFKEPQIIEPPRCAIVLDVSVSSQHQDYYKTIKEKLKSELSKLADNTEYLLIFSSNKVIKTITSKSKSNILSSIEDIKNQIYSPNHREAFKLASDFLAVPNHTFIIASLMDITGFEQALNVPFPHPTQIVAITAEPTKNNVNILGAHFVRTNQKGTTRLSTKIANESENKVDALLTYKSKNKVETQPFSLDAHQVGTLVLNTEIQPDEVITISHNSLDGYLADNSYYCLSPKLPIADILLLFSNKSQSTEELFLQEALQITDEKMIAINYNSLAVNDFTSDTIKKPDFLILSSCSEQLNKEQLNNIVEWNKNGMHIIITTNDEYRSAYSQLASVGIISQNAIKKIGVKYNSAPYFFSDINEKSPYTAIFTKKGANDFLSIPIYQYVKVSHQRNSEILLTAETDDPILLINRLGSGISFLFTISLDSTWSDLPITSVFLPLLRQIINVSMQTTLTNTEENLTPNSSLPLSKSEAYYFLNGHQIMVDAKNKSRFLTPESCGIYQIENKTYIVNIDRKHSKPNTLSAFEIKTKLQTTSINEKISHQPSQDDSLPKTLLYFLIFFIFLEIMLHVSKTSIKQEKVI